MMFSIMGAGALNRRSVVLACALSVTMTATLFAFPSIPQQSKSESRSRSRCATCLVRRDSVREEHDRLLIRVDSLKRAFERGRLNESEREVLGTQLRRAILALQESMEELHRTNALAMSQQGLEEARAALREMPEIAIAMKGPYQTRGYLGVVFDGTASRDFWRDNERIVQFYTYPRIALVEPSSPAEKAGIQQGDTLLALNGSDVRESEISLTRLLVPEHKLMVRVRRDGTPRDLKVIVGEAPAYVAGRAPRSPVRPSVPVVVGATPAPRVWPSDPARPSQSPEPPPRSVWVFQEGVAGARVETINEGLGRTIGIRSGILVIRAAPGTPAYESGLRDGDVILRAAGRSVGTVRELRGVLEREGDESGVRLAIMRERKQKEITLRW